MRKTYGMLAAIAGLGMLALAIPGAPAVAAQSESSGTVVTEGQMVPTAGKKKRRRAASPWQCSYYLVEKCCKNSVTGKEYCTGILQ